jgi:hypothetical protein
MKDQNNFAFENWCSYGANRRDYFDCEKEILVAVDVACHYFPANLFPTGHKPTFFIKRELQKLARMKKIGKA